MCPPAFDDPADMVFNGTDGQAIMYLKRLRRNSPLPDHVIDLNPYECMPPNLPGKMWYLVCSTEKNRTEFGFWRQKEASCEIFTNSDISVWRTTLEFIEIQDTREKLTDWVMQEYKITEKGPCSDKIEKESRAICNVFRSDRKNSNLEVHPNTREAVTLHRNSIHSVASIVPRIETERSPSMLLVDPLTTSFPSLVNNGVDLGLPVSEADRHLDPRIRDIAEYHYIADDDYLELDDLANPPSGSTSSDNSSRSSITLDDREYFDSEALLRELESNNNQSLQTESNPSFSVTASAKPFEVLMQPAALGSLVCASESQPAGGCTLPSLNIKTKDTDERVPDHTVKPGEPEKKGDPSCSAGAASSSNSGALVSTGKRKAAAVKIKGLKKYLCFMP